MLITKNQNFYQRLCLTCNASPKDVRKAFRDYVKIRHPDVCKTEDTTDEFKLVNEAYQTLSDPKKRSAYDIIFAESREDSLDKIVEMAWNATQDEEIGSLINSYGFTKEELQAALDRFRSNQNTSSRDRFQNGAPIIEEDILSSSSSSPRGWFSRLWSTATSSDCPPPPFDPQYDRQIELLERYIKGGGLRYVDQLDVKKLCYNLIRVGGWSGDRCERKRGYCYITEEIDVINQTITIMPTAKTNDEGLAYLKRRRLGIIKSRRYDAPTQ